MPARVRIPITVLGPDGRPLPGATGVVRRREDGNPVAVYAAETGGTTLGPTQIVTNDQGIMAGWTERDALEATVSPPGGVDLDPYIVAWEALPAGDETSETDWHAPQSVPGDALTDGSIELDDLAASVLGLIFAIGDMWPTCNPGDRASGRILSADGRTMSSATYAVLDSLIGGTAPAPFTHAYNDGVSPGAGLFRLPDKRGRASRGADDFGTARGAAGRLGIIAAGDRILGQGIGSDAVTLLAAQCGMPAHTHADTFTSAAETTDHIHNVPILFYTASGATTIAYGGQGVSGSIPTGGRSSSHTHIINGAVASVAAVNAASPHSNVGPSELDHWLIRVL